LLVVGNLGYRGEVIEIGAWSFSLLSVA
jgi:hypothetical protein